MHMPTKATRLDQVVAVAQDDALAGTRKRLSNHKLLAFLNNCDGARILVTDTSEHVLVFVQSQLLVDLIARVQLVVLVCRFGQQWVHAHQLGVPA